jgi:hypothetical protein
VQFLLNDGRPELLRNTRGASRLEERGIKHNIYQWDAVFENDTLFKGGWAGQGLIINPTWDVVAVFTSYFKEDHSEVRLEEKVFEVLNGVFGNAENLNANARDE